MATWKKVNSIQDFMSKAIKDIEEVKKQVLKDMAEDIHSILYIYTQNWYNAKDPSTYDRTYEFINSLTIRFINEDEVEIGFDASKMTLGTNNGWQQHEDRFYPLSQIIDEGWEFRTDGSHALEEAIKYMKSNAFITEVKNTFIKYGYKCTWIRYGKFSG